MDVIWKELEKVNAALKDVDFKEAIENAIERSQLVESSIPIVIYGAILALSLLIVSVAWLKLYSSVENNKTEIMRNILIALPFSLSTLAIIGGDLFEYAQELAQKAGCSSSNTVLEILKCNTPAWKETNLGMDSAIRIVNTPNGWVFTSQDLMFSLSLFAFLHLEGARLGVSRFVVLAMVLIGILGGMATCVGFALSYFLLLKSQEQDTQQKRVSKLPLTLVLCSIVITKTIVVLPNTFEYHRNTFFMWSLIAMGIACVLPCIIFRPSTTSSKSPEAKRQKLFTALFFATLAGASALLHIENLMRATLYFLATKPDGGPAELAEYLTMEPFTKDHCQRVVSADVILATAATILYMVSQVSTLRGFYYVILTFCFGISVSFPLFLGWESEL
mmetsp:Transcript_555/g.1415  ORF Transcript_555/g.1415 Transcript_555/m.1415 type:complete len:390 (-) Transcript_555:431-1600(-)|eukprot:CAMPEP_0171571576 /NCGR_PEP_ID=MMETSP0961-20121227/3585_1 /TAXON_ID=87120 /ORGANISM="Aurantiochytrium limacinum, Strain ATCCMYA-1381" /LENGTH=389 /DNA_ID=CAMNT_0012126209 /DNA_START=56 /DNA_END=1225 /DNA_ORIENTATION=+